MESPRLSSLEIANIVASAELDIELDLAAIAADDSILQGTEIASIKHSQNQGNRLLVRFEGVDGLGIVSPTGVLVLTGVGSHRDLDSAQTQLTDVILSVAGVDSTDSVLTKEWGVRNLVCLSDLGHNLQLERVVVELGLERVEYEPEQFPGVVYNVPGMDATCMVFATGKVNIMGVTTEDEASEALSVLKTELGHD
jgi:transcription initiation factor TFIID TATA-box-binding protein